MLGGLLLIILAAGILFWDNTQNFVITEEMRAQANVERMEARTRSQIQSKANRKPVPTHAQILESYRKHHEEQVRWLVIVLGVSGLLFLSYGVIKKEES